MGKTEHFLFRAKPSAWPRAVLTLSVRVEWIADKTNPLRQIVQLSSWNIALVLHEKAGYIVARTACGGTVKGFWDGLREAISRTKSLYIICGNTRVAASALGLWEALENGEICVYGTECGASASSGREMSAMPGGGEGDPLGRAEQVDSSTLSELPRVLGKKGGGRRGDSARTSGGKAGLMILQDPPIAMELQLAGDKSKITWVDIANYGLDSSSLFGNDEFTATKLAQWFIAAVGTIKSCGTTGWKNTAGAQAMHIFRSNYLGTPILSHTEPLASALEVSGLFGGRCECYRLGAVAGNCHLYDVRSMYPYLCANIAVPVRLLRVLDWPQLAEISVLPADTFTIAHVAIETDEPDYPYRSENGIVYPVGRYWTFLCGTELQHALSAGVVRGVRRAALYETEFAIRGYARDLYAHRCACDDGGRGAESAYVKRLMVSVVGKFAQRERNWEEMPAAESPFEWGEWYRSNSDGESERWRSIAGNVQRETTGGASHGSVGAITAAITSAGRSRLREIVDIAGREHTIYCDTDAVIVDDYGAEQLTIAGWVRPGEWGWLQHVESGDGCILYGDKFYTIGKRVRSAGKKAIDSREDCRGTGVAVQPWIAWSMRHQQRPADWRESHPFTKTLGRYDRPRGPGGEVKPIVLWEWGEK